MASARGVSRPNLWRSFCVVAAIMAFGILWLAIGGSNGQPVSNAAAASSQSLAHASVSAAGLNLPPLELSVAAPHQSASLTAVTSNSGHGDNLAALMWAAIGAVTLTILVMSLAWTHRPVAAPTTREETTPVYVISRVSSS